eukprot:gene29675-33411_t
MSIHITTPLQESLYFSGTTGHSVWLKMEAAQPSGSFKTRGIGHLCSHHKAHGAKRLLSSSGGNAGLAVAYAGRQLALPVLVVVPETTSQRAKTLIRNEHAEVIVHGRDWSEANEHVLALCGAGDAFIHPFDDALIWQGHASMIDELAQQGPKPDAIVLSVGGGGLLCGVAEGLQRNGWSDVAIIAAETAGADSYAQSLAAGRRITLPAITSIATSLGARTVCERAMALPAQFNIHSVVVSDRQAVAACIALLDEHRIVVEPACGASLAGLEAVARQLPDAQRVVVIVCGGVGYSATQLLDTAAHT